jgi:hypothetical protein
MACEGAAERKLRVPGVRASVEYEVDGRPHDRSNAQTALRAIRLSAGVPRLFLLFP